MNEHIILVAFEVGGSTIKQAQRHLIEHLTPIVKNRTSNVTSWWIAEDTRVDGSDNESAIFIPQEFSQRQAYHVLTDALVHRSYNDYDDDHEECCK